jgi:ATP-binding protein involved in chromosome partitioning
VLEKEIEIQLAAYRDPYLGMYLGKAKAIKRIAIEQDRVEIDLVLGYPHETLKNELIAAISDYLRPVLAAKKLELKLKLNLTSHIDAHVGKQGLAALPQIKNIIAVASGKGGVGKSTIAVNLALALAQEGANVGLLDADIYGPSQPAMLGTAGEKPVIKDRSIQPMLRHGIQSISIGNLVDANAALAWRGPMLGKALEQLIHDTQWKGLDYLVVDLPPGTGDVQLTLCQKIPVSGAVIVTTPQDLALHDVRRACEMFKKLNVPILGVVENMSGYHCSQCGHEEKIFGQGGGETLAKEYELALLAQIPLNIRIREMTDSGCPPVLQEPNGNYAKMFGELARKTAAKLAGQTKDYSARFPKIVVENKNA